MVFHKIENDVSDKRGPSGQSSNEMQTLPVKKRRNRLKSLLFGILIVFILFLPLIVWLFSSKSPWRIQVVDKTVPHPDYREHAALLWTLNHYKVPPPSGKGKWKRTRDYIGYYPERLDASKIPERIYLSRKQIRDVNLLFIADTYGVYLGDYVKGQKYQAHLDYSTKIYGGLNIDEVEAIEDFISKGGALVAEFNTFASPTSGEARRRLESILGLEWTKWSGRFFDDLGDESEVPVWARRNWETHYDEKWDFTGPGFLITNENTRLFVLKDKEDLKSQSLSIIKVGEAPMMKGVSKKADFWYWFDVVRPVGETEILAEYQFSLTAKGREIMRQFGLEERFPAVLQASRSPLRVYFAGDFSDNKINYGPYFIAGWPRLRALSSFLDWRKDQGDFFWRFYVPLMRNLFKGSPEITKKELQIE